MENESKKEPKGTSEAQPKTATSETKVNLTQERGAAKEAELDAELQPGQVRVAVMKDGKETSRFAISRKGFEQSYANNPDKFQIVAQAAKKK